jgi:hypothetical protein
LKEDKKKEVKKMTRLVEEEWDKFIRAIREDTFSKDYMVKHKGALALGKLINQYKNIVRKKGKDGFQSKKKKRRKGEMVFRC